MRLSTTLLLLSASPACALRSVLVVGGNGRVGASTVRWLHKLAAAEDARANAHEERVRLCDPATVEAARVMA